MTTTLHAHTARPLRRSPPHPSARRLLVHLAGHAGDLAFHYDRMADILAFVCRVLARRIPQVGP